MELKKSKLFIRISFKCGLMEEEEVYWSQTEVVLLASDNQKLRPILIEGSEPNQWREYFQLREGKRYRIKQMRLKTQGCQHSSVIVAIKKGQIIIERLKGTPIFQLHF